MIKLKHHFIMSTSKRRNKFGAIKCSYDGYSFDSQKEGKAYQEYKLELAQGYIKDLIVHPVYPIHINCKLICKVELDFQFFDIRLGKNCYIDVKAWDKKKHKYITTRESSLKRKILEASYNIQVDYI